MTDEDFSALAGEFALGLLAGEELAAAEALLRADPRFAAAVLGWETRLMPLLEVAPPVPPSAAVWRRIEAAVRPAGGRQTIRKPWLGWSLAGVAAAAALALGIFVSIPDRKIVATMPAAGGGEFVISENGKGLLVTARDVPIPAGRVAELWLIVPPHAPRALGLFGTAGGLATRLPVVGDVLAVSLEPVGGSVTGAPTGPVIAQGDITKL